MKMKKITSLLVLICVSNLTWANVLWEEDFETNSNDWFGDLTSFEFTENYAKTGIRAIINNDNYDKQMTHLIGDLDQMIYECWFYDLMGDVAETGCVVSESQKSTSKTSLYIGIETQKSNDYYSYFLSPDVNAWGISTIPRTKGWHKAEFIKKGKNTELKLDGKKISETDKIDWKYVGITLNNWYSGKGHDAAIFDSLKVSGNFEVTVKETQDEQNSNSSQSPHQGNNLQNNNVQPLQQGNCVVGFIGSAYCKGKDVYRTYVLDDCSSSEKIVKRFQKKFSRRSSLLRIVPELPEPF